MLKINNEEIFAKWISNIKNTFDKEEDGAEKNIYIDAYWAEYLGVFLPRFLYAKGLQTGDKKYKIYALSENSDFSMQTLCNAYGIRLVNIRNKVGLFKALLLVLKWFAFSNSEEKIYKINYKGILIGNYIADFIIRHTDSLFSLKKFRFSYLKLMLVFAWSLIEIDKLFAKTPPSIYLILETGFWFGPVIKLAEQHKATIIQCSSGNRAVQIGNRVGIPINSIDSWNYEVHCGVDKIQKEGIDYKSWASEYYRQRRKGLTDKDAEDAYANKVIITRKEWIEKNSADPNKKNIVIMAHCFSDDANTTTSRSIYRDYYQWLVNTLDIIHNINNVNWLLRAHPGRAVYNEGDFIYEIFSKYEDKNNIYVLDDDISSDALYEIIDGAVTVLGTCGLEFSSFGIPVVCAGLSSYGGFGFTMEPLSEDEYIHCLSHMDEIVPLSQEKIDLARKVSYAYFNLRKPVDVFDEIFDESLKMNADKTNDFVIERLNNLYEEGYSEKECFFYKHGEEVTRRIDKC